MNPAIRETDGVVLDSRDHGESDLILTFFCRDSGRTTAIAKGARKSLKRFVNKLELFSFLHLTLRQRTTASLAYLEEAELHAGFITLRQEVSRYTAASVIREVTLLATREGEADERLYALLLWALHQLDKGMPYLRPVMLFLLLFHDYIGYRPGLSRCDRCGVAAAANRDFAFSIISGGLVCDRCQPLSGQGGIRLQADTIGLLSACQDRSLQQLATVEIAEASLYEGLNILHRYARHVLGRDIISWPMLRTTLKQTRVSWDAQR